MLTIEEISARLEITQVLTDYATAVDSGRFDDLGAVFTDDAVIDYRVMGGIIGTPTQVTAWLGEVLPLFSAYCHLVGNVDINIDVDGATAMARSLCLNPLQTPDTSTVLIGLWYNDTLTCTDDGWRITSRTLEKCFDARMG